MPPGGKSSSLQRLVRPVMEYGSSVWDPPGVVLQEELESVRKRAARFMTGNYKYETGKNDWHSWTVKMGIPQEKGERQ